MHDNTKERQDMSTKIDSTDSKISTEIDGDASIDLAEFDKLLKAEKLQSARASAGFSTA